MKDRIVFECLGFSTNPVFYRLDCGYLYQIGTVYSHKGFDTYGGFLPRDKEIPILPTKEEVESEYHRRLDETLKSKGSTINSGIVYAG